MCRSSRWPRGSPQPASRPTQPSRPLRAGAHGVTRRGARGLGRGAGESQPERAGRCGRARAGRRCARREQRSARSRRARRRTAREAPPPAPGARSSPPLSPLTLPLASGRLPGCVHRGPESLAHGALATARPPGGRHRLEPRTPTGTLEECRGAAAVTPRGDAGGAGREPLGSAGPDGAATPCARWAGPRGGQP